MTPLPGSGEVAGAGAVLRCDPCVPGNSRHHSAPVGIRGRPERAQIGEVVPGGNRGRERGGSLGHRLVARSLGLASQPLEQPRLRGRCRIPVGPPERSRGCGRTRIRAPTPTASGKVAYERRPAGASVRGRSPMMVKLKLASSRANTPSAANSLTTVDGCRFCGQARSRSVERPGAGRRGAEAGRSRRARSRASPRSTRASREPRPNKC